MFATTRTDKLPGKHIIGVLRVNPHYGTYIRHGRYFVEFLTPAGVAGHLHIDFVSVPFSLACMRARGRELTSQQQVAAAEAMLREGQRVYITVDVELYADIRALHPRLVVPDAALHARLRADSTTTFQLHAWYSLGDVTLVETDAFATNACIRVAIETDDARTIVVSVALNRAVVDRDRTVYEPIVSLERLPDHGPVVRTLVSGKYAQDRSRPHGKRLCWSHAM